MSDSYIPAKRYLKRYAEVLVNYALNSGNGVKPGEVVQCLVPDVAKPLALQLQNTILRAGAHPLIKLMPTEFDKDYYTFASDDQLTFFPNEYMRARADLIDHSIGIIADVNPTELKTINPQKIMKARNSRKLFRDWLTEKELNNEFTWTLALWGVPAKAEIVGLSLEEYWQQIIRACFLDKADPLAKWREVTALQQKIKDTINSMKIEWIHMKGTDVDLKVQIGADRKWNAGSGRNIPSFELFTSPNWRGTTGWITFNEPLYRYGSVIEKVRLEFKDGLVSKASAKKGNRLLQEMLKTENANKLGEYSLTDTRLSRITHPMAETLFDENIGGPFGNTHVAIGMAYKDCYAGDAAKLTKEDWEEKGFNDSAEHTDIVSTTDRVVTATLQDGTEKVIYANGKFTIVE